MLVSKRILRFMKRLHVKVIHLAFSFLEWFQQVQSQSLIFLNTQHVKATMVA